MPPPHGVRMVTGAKNLTRAAIAQAREFAGDLIDAGIDVIGKLNLGHRPQSVHTHADGGGDDSTFGRSAYR